MLGRDDLVITGATLGNPPFEELVRAAATGGFQGLSINPGPVYFATRARGLSAADMRAMLDDHGLAVNDVDAVLAWVGSERPAVIEGEHPSEEQMYQAGEALGARHANVVFVGHPSVAVDRAAEMFAGMSERAANHGLTAYLEFVPSMSPVKDARTAWQIVQASGRADAGVLLDTWHVNCGPTTEADLHELPGERVLGIQISDAPDKPPEELVGVGMHERMAPGEGSLDLVGFLRLLDQIGCTAPLTVEVFSDELRSSHAPSQLAERLGDAVRTVRARARG